MADIEVNGRNIELSDEGFIARPEDWNEDVARAFGVLENIPLLTGPSF
jgi:tRNA 2-thiouridine synthesizing protein E